MDKLNLWIKKYPIAAFFIIGIIVCFATFFPAILVIPQDDSILQMLTFYLAKIAAYSPVLTGMYISRVSNPIKQKAPLSRRVSVFLPVWLVSEIILTISLRQNAPASVPLIALTIFALPAAILPAWVITSAFFGTDGVRDMLSTLIRPKGKIIYYLIAFLTFPAIHIIGAGITNFLEGAPIFPQITQAADLAYTLTITFISVLLFSGGINEESGWRGFAQKRLQSKHSPLTANLILWLILVVWHIPNDIIQYKDGGYLLVRFALYPFITVLFGWVYNRTNGSILAPVIFHASMNTMNQLMGLFPITTAGNILLVSFALIAVISSRMWKRLPADHPALHQPQELAENQIVEGSQNE